LNFVADESVDRQIVDALRRAGQQVWYVAEGELVFRQGWSTVGIVLVRLAGLSLAHKAEIVVAAIRAHATELPQAFSVIMPRTIRIRPRIKKDTALLRVQQKHRHARRRQSVHHNRQGEHS
jgi:transcription elongation factor GreA-like protein